MITMTLNFCSISSEEVDRLGTLATLDVDNDTLVAEMNPDTINPIDAIWLQGLAAAHEVQPEATVETPEAA